MLIRSLKENEKHTDAPLAILISLAALNVSADFDKGTAASREEHYEMAFQDLKKAAEQGHAPAQFALGNMYRTGEGVNQDEEEAMTWYQQSRDMLRHSLTLD